MLERRTKTKRHLPQSTAGQLDNCKTGIAKILVPVVILISAAAAGKPAHADMLIVDKLKIYGDFRARLESDFDSQRGNGINRADRSRARVRVRVGLKYEPTENFIFNVRVRSGSDDSHQSPHITVVDFNDNDSGDADFNPDKWYMKAKNKNFWGWIGRNGLPIWKQNELFWDDDVTPAGIAAGFKFDLGGGKVAGNGGYFVLPVGMQEFSGNLAAGQIVISKTVGSVGVTLAGGVFEFQADTDDPDGVMLVNTNGMRDYTIYTGSVQTKFKPGNLALPLVLGFDYMHNGKDYSSTDPDAFTVANRKERDGYVISARLGQLKKAREWLAGYYYAHIETLAVNSSFAQDDWVRWGSATETRGSNMKGHEFRLAYAFSKMINVVARLYIVEAITSIEDGNRARLDFNYKF